MSKDNHAIARKAYHATCRLDNPEIEAAHVRIVSGYPDQRARMHEL